MQILSCGSGAVEQQPKIVRPELDIASHRFAVKPHVVGNRTEKDMGQLVFIAQERQFVLVAQDLSPAMSSPKRISDRTVVFVWKRFFRMRLMQPARLRNANALGSFVPAEQVH